MVTLEQPFVIQLPVENCKYHNPDTVFSFASKYVKAKRLPGKQLEIRLSGEAVLKFILLL